MQSLMKIHLKVVSSCTKGQFTFLFQVGQGFSLKLVQHLFMVE